MSDTSESFDIEEYAKQTEYLKSNNARILNNVFHASLSSLKKTLISCTIKIELFVLKYYFRPC
jgi:hypothetical protein